jgi:hypothetical protein
MVKVSENCFQGSNESDGVLMGLCYFPWPARWRALIRQERKHKPKAQAQAQAFKYGSMRMKLEEIYCLNTNSKETLEMSLPLGQPRSNLDALSCGKDQRKDVIIEN